MVGQQQNGMIDTQALLAMMMRQAQDEGNQSSFGQSQPGTHYPHNPFAPSSSVVPSAPPAAGVASAGGGSGGGDAGIGGSDGMTPWVAAAYGGAARTPGANGQMGAADLTALMSGSPPPPSTSAPPSPARAGSGTGSQWADAFVPRNITDPATRDYFAKALAQGRNGGPEADQFYNATGEQQYQSFNDAAGTFG